MTLTDLDQSEVGRVLYASTTGYVFGCNVVQARDTAPAFGSLVRSDSLRAPVYGLVYDVRVTDDQFVRQLVVARDIGEVYIEDQRHNRHVPIEISALAVGYQEGADAIRPMPHTTPAVRRLLPPLPPLSLDRVFTCSAAELAEFSTRFDYFSTVLSAPRVPAEELLAAHLTQAAAVRPAAQRREFLVRASKELARLLAGDLLKLDVIVRKLQP